MLSMDGPAILYRQQLLSWPLRLFMLVLGLSLGIFIPLPFVIHTDWTTPNLVQPVAVLAIAAPLAFAVFIVAAALWSASELRLDPATGRADRILRGPIVNRSDSFPLFALSISEVMMRDSEDGPYPLLRLTLPHRLPLDIVCFLNRDEAERWQRRIAATLVA